MTVIYKTELKPETRKFIEKYIARFDCSGIETITFKETRGRDTTGICYYPVSARTAGKHNIEPRKHYTIICRVGRKIKYPYLEQTYVGCEKTGSSSLKWHMDEEVLGNKDEAAVFVFGHEMWHFLRKTKQVPGRNTQSQANKNGFRILRNYKKKYSF